MSTPQRGGDVYLLPELLDDKRIRHLFGRVDLTDERLAYTACGIHFMRNGFPKPRAIQGEDCAKCRLLL